MNRGQLLAEIARRLKEMGVDDGAEEARHALSWFLGCDISALLLGGHLPADEGMLRFAQELLTRRAAHEPLAYILGERWFMGMPFAVSRAVLIPRQDTELLAEEAILKAEAMGAKTGLDICTGSGCVAVSLAKYTAMAVVGSDISPEALAVAKANGKKNGVDVKWRLSDLFADIPGCYDIITANPPYVTEEEYAGLMAEVRDYEPKLALTAPNAGLALYEKLIPGANAKLNPGGWLLCEIGCSQAQAVAELFAAAGYRDVQVKKDLAGLDRVVLGRKGIHHV
ncbi:MAG: peptide chain release factor N(5)-glutamine methyltransferase [Christensenellaceae bacterium]|nr:peptide chain release factor N(5)-glutamine methyltransferase [Christensenellaceae bacterium]